MTDPRLLALLHAELDGDLDAAGRAELASHLATDPELARLRAELAAVDAGLAALPAVEPPALVLADILAGLPPVRRETVVVALRAPAAVPTPLPSVAPVTVIRSRRMVRVWAYAASLFAVMGAGVLLQQSGLLTAELAGENSPQPLLRLGQMREMGVFAVVSQAVEAEIAAAIGALRPWPDAAPTPLLLGLCDVLQAQVASVRPSV